MIVPKLPSSFPTVEGQLKLIRPILGQNTRYANPETRNLYFRSIIYKIIFGEAYIAGQYDPQDHEN